MKLNFKTSEKFRILLYNSKIPSRKVKENMDRYGYNEIIFVSEENSVVNTVKGLDPQVIILHHHPWNDEQTPLLVSELRQSCDTPVIIWSDDINEPTSRKLLSFKNTYTLSLSEGFNALTEVLSRIEMKIKNPALWV